MCVTRVRTYVYPDGRKDVIETPEYCPRSVRNQPCKNHRRREYPEQAIASSSSVMGSPSLVDDVTTPSSGSFPPTPVSATSGPRLELRQPTSGSSKGKEKVRRPVNQSDLRLDFGKNKKESSSRRPEERSNQARFADEESGSTARPETPSRRGRGDQPSPSILRSPASTGLGSPLPPRVRRTPTEVHQPNPPFSSRVEAPRLRQPTPGLHRRTNTEPEDISRPSSTGATVGTDADVFTRADARAQAREENQRQERERRRLEEERTRRFERQQQEAADRRFAERLESELNLNSQRRARQAANESRERAEDEYSLREYERINSREAIREAQRQRRAEEDRLRRIREQLREREDQDQVERVARQVRESRERRERLADNSRREAEEEIRSPSDGLRHEAERRRESRLQEAISQMARLNEESELTAIQLEIQRLTNEIEYDREEKRQRERGDELAAERRRLDELQEEIALLEELQSQSDEVARAERELRELNRASSQRSSWYGSPSYYPPAGYIGSGASYTSPTTPTSLSGGRPSSGGGGSAALQTRSPFEDANFRRVRGEQILRQERALANARDSAQEMQRAVVSDEEAYMSGGRGLGRRNTVGGGGRARETAYRGQRRYYPG